MKPWKTDGGDRGIFSEGRYRLLLHCASVIEQQSGKVIEIAVDICLLREGDLWGFVIGSLAQAYVRTERQNGIHIVLSPVEISLEDQTNVVEV